MSFASLTLTGTAFSRTVVCIEAPAARISLHNPPLNVIDIPMMEEMAQALTVIEARQDISVVVLSGEGKAFSAGVDVAAHTPDKVETMLQKFHAVIRAVVGSKKVTIAAVRGHCLGVARSSRWSATWSTLALRRSGDFPRSSSRAIRQSHALRSLP